MFSPDHPLDISTPPCGFLVTLSLHLHRLAACLQPFEAPLTGVYSIAGAAHVVRVLACSGVVTGGSPLMLSDYFPL